LHHKKGVRFLLTHPAGGLFLDPGLGKTSITLKAFQALQQAKVARRMLVIAPLRPCYLVWPAEQTKWRDFNSINMQLLHDSTLHDSYINKDVDVYVTNPDSLPWLLDSRRFARLQADTLCIDESSKFKHTKIRRFKLLKRFLPSFERRWILTGSPNPNGYLDLFGQIYILDLGKALGQYVTHYRTQYFFQTGFMGYEWRLQKGAEQRIHKALKPLVLRLDADDYLNMPKQVDSTVRVELPTKARKAYEELEHELITEFDSGHVVTALSKGSVYIKCAQVANGGLYHNPEDYESSRTFEHIHDAKTEALRDLVEELQGTPLLIAYEFKHDIVRIRKMLGDIPMLGEGSLKQDVRLEEQWNAGKLPLLLGHPASVGHGLNLQSGQAHHVAWYGLTWDFELYDQFNRRIRRSGNRNKQVFVYHFVARNTVDEAKIRALKSKAHTQRNLLDALRVYLRDK
jgi:SNF2 family DNA or RNA helicase